MVKLWYDEESELFAIEPSTTSGYTVNSEKVHCRTLPSQIPKGRYEAYWDKERSMIIANLKKKIIFLKE
jgi:hypothetical protein